MSRFSSHFLLMFALLSAPAVLADDGQSPAQVKRAYLGDGTLLSGSLHEWRQAVDTLARLGFDCVGQAGDGPAPAVAEYLQEKALSVCPLTPLAAAGTEEEPDAAVNPNGRRLLGPDARPALIAGLLAPVAENGVLWADDGNGAISAWPPEAGLFRGILLHAGSASDGPIVNPYPARLGASVEAAVARGLAGEVWVAAPSFWPFLLNLEATVSALNGPAGFDPDAFYRAWVAQRYGPETVAGTVTALKLLHAAREREPGFAEITRQSKAIIDRLANDGAFERSTRPSTQSLEYLRRAAGLAQANAAKTAADQTQRYDEEIVVPVSLYLANLELFDELIQLESARRIARDFPAAELSQQRVEQSWAVSLERARELERWLKRNGPAHRADVPISAMIEALEAPGKKPTG